MGDKFSSKGMGGEQDGHTPKSSHPRKRLGNHSPGSLPSPPPGPSAPRGSGAPSGVERRQGLGRGMRPRARPRPQPEARAAPVPGSHSPALLPPGARPEGPGRVATPGAGVVWRWPGGAGPWRSGGSGSSRSGPVSGDPAGPAPPGEGDWPRVPGAAGGSSSSSGSSSSRSGGGGEAMVAAPARAHMPGARGGRGAGAGAREASGGCCPGPGK